MYRALHDAGVTEIVCDFCAGAFHVKKSLEERKAARTAEYENHPSIAKWVDRGYVPVVL